MVFSSYEFLIFLLITFSLYYLTPTRFRVFFLILASLSFYSWWSLSHLTLLLGSILLNYLISLLIAGTRWRGVWLTAGIALNLLLLAIFKYADFVILSINHLPTANLQPLDLALPLAISFFTFQQIAYLVDVSRNETRPYRLQDYALFVAFFPQLIAGPIVHHREMMPQFAKLAEAPVMAVNLIVGLTLFAIGLFKKVILADQFGLYADELFAAVDGGYRPAAVEAWCGSIAYSLQIYFDFSGYCDMAIGIARLFGIRLPVNFFSPYKARSIVDFWRRWHITLSRFLRHYLYIPLGGNRRGHARRYANLMITMLLGGLWHGAGWTFIVWGGLHGCYLIINHAWIALTARHGALAGLAGAGRVIGPGLTFLAVVVAWVFFRAASFESAWQILAGMAGGHGLMPEVSDLAMFDDKKAAIWLASGLAIVWLMPNSLQIMKRYRPAADLRAFLAAPPPSFLPWSNGMTMTWRLTPVWAVFSGVAAAAALLGISKISPFLYFQF